uniref:PAX interacting protein 1 n=1 Tax=Pan paniscus TaxID=9597 RepID=A0A2R9AY01_PANPA
PEKEIEKVPEEERAGEGSVIQLLKAGKAKEVSYNALASHIISEDGDNPEVGEAREVFDLPVVKVISCKQYIEIFFGITACLSQGVDTSWSSLLESSRALPGRGREGSLSSRSWEAQRSSAFF